MRFHTLSLAGAVTFGLLSMTAALAQATIEDCEKIQAADAYNQCLAKFGPTSKLKNLEPGRPSDFKTDSAEAAASAGPAKSQATRHGRRYGGRVARRGHGATTASSGGRKRMVISVGRRRHR